MTTNEIAHKFQEPGNFLQFQLRDILTVLAIGGAIVSFFLTREGGSATLTEQVKQLRSAVDVTNTTVLSQSREIHAIDTKGTEHEQQILKTLGDKDTEHERRLTNMEAVLQQAVPDIREIKTKVQIVADFLEKGRK